MSAVIDEVNKTRGAVLSLLLKGGPLSAGHLASSIGISVQAMRKHLRSLECDAMVEHRSIISGPGRPSNLWQLTSKGYEFFSNGEGSERFAVNLLESIESAFAPGGLEEVLTKQALAKAFNYRRQIGLGELQARLQKLVELRNKEGNLTEFQRFPDSSGSWYLNAFHCSIHTIAERFPMICEKELELIRQVFPDCLVDRVQWKFDRHHSCGFKITPHQ